MLWVKCFGKKKFSSKLVREKFFPKHFQSPKHFTHLHMIWPLVTRHQFFIKNENNNESPICRIFADFSAWAPLALLWVCCVQRFLRGKILQNLPYVIWSRVFFILHLDRSPALLTFWFSYFLMRFFKMVSISNEIMEILIFSW